MYDSKRLDCEQELKRLKKDYELLVGVQQWYLREKRRADNLEFENKQLKRSKSVPYKGYIG